MKIWKYSENSANKKADFYIQSHGFHAGRPLKIPKRNCFAVKSDNPNAYEIVFCLFKGRAFKNLIIGSVIPFIRKREIEVIIKEAVTANFEERHLMKVRLIENCIINLQKQLETLNKLHIDYAYTLYRNSIKK